MIQEIAVAIVVASAVVWVGVKIYRSLTNKSADPCGGCTSSCNSCAVFELKKEIEQKKAERIQNERVLE